MIYPAQTSLIPVQIALARFLESLGGLGINSFNQNYPYWYLGTTPFRYLTGPILPSVLAFIHRLVPNLSLFEIMFGVIAVCWTLGTMGVYLLVRELTPLRKVALLSAMFYFFGPIVPFLFRFSDGLYLIAFSFLPFILLLQHRGSRTEDGRHGIRKIDIFLGILITFVILLDSLIIPTLVLGMVALLLTTSGWQRIEERLKRIFLIFAFSFLISTLWYTPGYWWTLLGAPSFGGKGLAMVIVWLGKLLPTVLALIIAVFSVKFFKKRNTLRDFTFYWLFIFGFLTFLRFLSDPDFWLDWTAYGPELQLGLAVLGGMTVNRLVSKRIVSFIVYCLWFVVWLFIANKYVLGTLQKDITQTVEYRISSQLSQIAKPDEQVFLSGTTAFWLNAFFNLHQIRGGRDQAAVNPDWRQGAWEIREGTNPESTENWLSKLDVSYLVVHTQDSEEFYHDFKNPEKFETIKSLKKVFQENGDIIYQIQK